MQRNGGMPVVFVVASLAISCAEPSAVMEPEARRSAASTDGGRHTVVVDPEGRGHATTIQEGIDLVRPGGRVLVKPATYDEKITIDKGLRLEGLGRRGARIAPSSPGGTAIDVVTTDHVVIQRMTIENPTGTGIFGGPSGRLTVDRVKVFRTTFAIFFASTGATPGRIRVSRSLIDGGPNFEMSNGIFVAGTNFGRIERNHVVRGAGFACIQIQGTGARAEIIRNFVDYCGGTAFNQPAVKALGADHVDMIANVIRNSGANTARAAIQYVGGTGRVERNRIVDFMQPSAPSDGAAVQLLSGAAPSVRFNDIAGNAIAGLRATGTPMINATCNWWGAPDGPSGIGPGSGDAAFGSATVVPFSTRPIAGTDRRHCSDRLDARRLSP